MKDSNKEFRYHFERNRLILVANNDAAKIIVHLEEEDLNNARLAAESAANTIKAIGALTAEYHASLKYLAKSEERRGEVGWGNL